jgi:DNA-binding transcriptional LysR family regulator
VGTIATLGVIDLLALMARYHDAHPQVKIRIVHGAASALVRSTAHAQLDIVFVDCPIDPDRLTVMRLGRDRLCLAAPADDPLVDNPMIRLDDPRLRSRTFVEYRADSALRAQIDTACAGAGLARQVGCEVDTMDHLVDCVRHRIGLAILPTAALDQHPHELTGIQIVPELPRTIVAAHIRDETSAVTRALLALLSEQTAVPTQDR